MRHASFNVLLNKHACTLFVFKTAGFAMTLKLINNKIIFTPNFPDVEASLLETYDTILRGMFDRMDYVEKQ